MLPAGTTGDHKEKEKSLVDEVPPAKSKACAKKPEAGKKLSEKSSTTKTNVFFAAGISTITAGAVLFF